MSYKGVALKDGTTLAAGEGGVAQITDSPFFTGILVRYENGSVDLYPLQAILKVTLR